MIKINLDKRLLLLLPILSGAMWGSGGVFVRILNSFGLNSVSILSTRVFGASLILFILLMLFDRDSLKIKLKDLWLFIGSGVLGALLLNLCYNEAAFTLSLSLASLLLSLAPIFALVLSAILFKEKITGRKLICLVITLIGCLFVSGLLETSNGFNWSTHGMIFGLASALFWALYGVFSKLASNKGYSTFTIIFYTFLIIAICLAPFTDWNTFGSFLVTNPGPHTLFAILHSVFTSILPYFLFSVALTNIDNGKATILCSSAEPISATIFGALIYLEIPSSLNILGIIISLIGLALLTKSNEIKDE
ncbi:MAG: DMT family transporter [archaeon]|nr:DMT family transporter [archaeon]